MSTGAFRKMTTLSAIASGTEYTNAHDETEAIAKAAGNDDAMMSWMIGRSRTLDMQAGRPDYGGAAFSTRLEGARRTRDEIRSTGGVSVATQKLVDESIYDSAIDSSNPAQLVYGNPGSAEHLGDAYLRRIERETDEVERVAADPTSTQEQIDTAGRSLLQTMASAGGLYDAMNQASPQNAREFANRLMARRISVANLPPSLRAQLALQPGGLSSSAGPDIGVIQAMENLRANNPTWAETRHDYRTGIEHQLQNQGNIPQPGPGGPPPPPGSTP